MKDVEKLKLLEDMLELEPGTLKPEMTLEDMDTWDSIAVISFIALVDDEFDKIIKGTTVKDMKTVADLMVLMSEE